MTGRADLHAVDELVAGPPARQERSGLGRLVPRVRPARPLVAVAAVLVAVTIGPGLLSGQPPAPADPPRGGAAERDDGRAGIWTGGPERPSGNRFVQSPVRLLRLPA